MVHLLERGAMFGHLKAVTGEVVHKGKEGKGFQPHYLCRCVCGSERLYYKYNLTSGKSKSCGCVANLATSARHKTHGMSTTSIYAVWNMMKQRCLCPTYRRYEDYGGRGIKICDKWLEFEAFFADVGDPPFRGASLDRRNNDGNYEPGNVRWATRTEQNRNKRNTRRYEYEGKDLTLDEWATTVGINPRTLASRLYIYKWGIEKALTTAVK